MVKKIISKRNLKSESFQDPQKKIKKSSKGKVVKYDISRRTRFMTTSDKIKSIDIDIGHKIQEI